MFLCIKATLSYPLPSGQGRNVFMRNDDNNNMLCGLSPHPVYNNNLEIYYFNIYLLQNKTCC